MPPLASTISKPSEVAHELRVVDVDEAEAQEGRALDALLGQGALALVGARDLDDDAVVLAGNDEGLVDAEAVDAVAEDLNRALVRVLHDRGDFGVDLTVRLVGFGRLALLAELLLVDLHGEARAAGEVEAQPDLVLGRGDDDCGRNDQRRENQPLDYGMLVLHGALLLKT